MSSCGSGFLAAAFAYLHSRARGSFNNKHLQLLKIVQPLCCQLLLIFYMMRRQARKSSVRSRGEKWEMRQYAHSARHMHLSWHNSLPDTRVRQPPRHGLGGRLAPLQGATLRSVDASDVGNSVCEGAGVTLPLESQRSARRQYH